MSNGNVVLVSFSVVLGEVVAKSEALVEVCTSRALEWVAERRKRMREKDRQ